MGTRYSPWAEKWRSVWAVLAVWAIYCAIRLAIQPMLGWQPDSADDWTRLLQVRDLIAGQSWWDVTQYRMNPPEGFSMHWSRLVDVPLVGLGLVLGESAAIALVPLLYLLPVLFALRAIMLRLGLNDLAFGFGLVILPLFPMLPGIFAPTAIDHHTPQAVLGLWACALALGNRHWHAVLSGICAAAWVVISLEALPLVAALAAMLALRYLFGERNQLQWFLVALTIGTGLFGALFNTPAQPLLYCDVILPGHVHAIAAAAVIAVLLGKLPGQDQAMGRLLALGLIPLFALPLAFVQLGACATNPMAQLDPVLQTYWHGYITEGLPIWHQPFSMMLVLVWPIGLVVAGGCIAGRCGQFDQGRAIAWTVLGGFALAAALYSLLLMRAGVIAQLLAIPFAAFLLGHVLPRARAISSAVPRVLATLACFALATPVFASAFAKPLDPVLTKPTLNEDALALVAGEACDFGRLNILPPALIFAPLDPGPEILGRTGHSVVAASYHRNQQPMGQVIAALIGSVEDAEGAVRASGADYVLSCSSKGDVALYRSADPANFANALASGDVPSWLEPVSGFEEGSLRLYRVR